MRVSFPNFNNNNIAQWASGMIAALTRAFGAVPEGVVPGTVVLWDNAAELPVGYLLCDGSEYSAANYPALFKLYGESTPGNFEVPTITAPAGSIALVRVG